MLLAEEESDADGRENTVRKRHSFSYFTHLRAFGRTSRNNYNVCIIKYEILLVSLVVHVEHLIKRFSFVSQFITRKRLTFGTHTTSKFFIEIIRLMRLIRAQNFRFK